MANEMLRRPDLSAYVVAGPPKSFLAKLRSLAEADRADAEVMQLDDEMTEWLVAQLSGEKRRSHERTPASDALSAARYHLQDQPEEEQVRELRRLVEELWREISPEFAEDPDGSES